MNLVMSPLKILVFLVLSVFSTAKGFEALSTGIIIGGTFFGTALYAGWQNIKCQFVECCDIPWIKENLTILQQSLDRHVFGQHLVGVELMRALRAHVSNPRPKKALAMSFHGWTGGGKNYVSDFVAQSLYKEGLKSRYVRLFISTIHFPHKEKANHYKMYIQHSIKESIRNCKKSLFIFDEIDKMPEGVMDSIKPFIDYYETIDGVDYRKSIFIFLSNTGGREITKKVYKSWLEGYKREDIKYKDLEDLIHTGAFNERGGLHHSSLLERSLIDVYIPFLPLERQHVKKCAELEMEKSGVEITKERLNKIADLMTYWPAESKLYSTVGCKRVTQKVHEMAADLEYDHIFGEKSEL